MRNVVLPPGVRVIGVGGATLGGSGKTPTVLALASELAAERRVSVVGHGYRSRASGPRIVTPSADVREVGDEALMLARKLAPLGVSVVLARSRERAIARAAELGEIVIVDGLLQARPVRLFRSLLVVDAHEPWGSGRCPPVGDLRAAPDALLRACDHVVVPRSEITGAHTPGGGFVPASRFAGTRFGLALSLARPERVERELARLGVRPALVERAADHGRFRSGPRGAVEAWLTSAKCATKLGEIWRGAPVWVLEQRVSLPPGLAGLLW